MFLRTMRGLERFQLRDLPQPEPVADPIAYVLNKENLRWFAARTWKFVVILSVFARETNGFPAVDWDLVRIPPFGSLTRAGHRKRLWRNPVWLPASRFRVFCRMKERWWRKRLKCIIALVRARP